MTKNKRDWGVFRGYWGLEDRRVCRLRQWIRGLQKSVLVLVAALGGWIGGCGTSPFGARSGDFEPATISLTVGRHQDEALSDDEVDMIFAEASRVLQEQDDECPDVACPVTFELDGSVEKFTAGGAVLTTEDQLDEVFARPEDIKVVTLMLGVCGTGPDDQLAVVLGCAYTGGSAVLSRAADPDVWAHEWGHVQGLPHRDNCPRNLMHSYELETNAVSVDECSALLSPTPSRGLLRTRMPSEGCESCPAAEVERLAGETQRAWIERITSRTYRAGVPVEGVVAPLDAPAVDALLTVFESMQPAAWRGNAARLMGFSGDSRCAAALMDYLRSTRGPIDAGELGAVAESVLALGRLSGADETSGAFEFLIAGVEPATWDAAGLSVMGENVETAAIGDALARMCVMAIGLSQHSAADETLASLAEQSRTGRLVGASLGQQISEAICRRNEQCPGGESVGMP